MSNDAEVMQAKDFLGTYRTRADARLEQVLRGRNEGLAPLPFGVAGYTRLLTEYVLRGGKRFRGALVLLGYEAATGRDRWEVLDASLSFELAHAYLLAYDDVMDRDETRRGGPALHVAAARHAREVGAREPEHRGLSLTMLLGMYAQAVGTDLLVRTRAVRDAEPAAAVAYFNEVIEGVTIGQMLDVLAADAPAATLADVREIHLRKTGLYTTEGPVVLGALLGGARPDDAIVEGLRGWALPLGEAFQLVDDVLGAVGDPEETGKPASGDLREGKRSAVIEEALARLEGPRRERFRTLVGRPLDAAETEEAKGLVLASGAVEAVRERARLLARMGCEELAEASPRGNAGALLDGIATLVVERSS